MSLNIQYTVQSARSSGRSLKSLKIVGIFYLVMVNMGILYKRFRDAELEDALIQSSIVAANDFVVWVLRGKNYKRGISLYKMFYEALSRLFISQQQKNVGSNKFEKFAQEIDATKTVKRKTIK